MAVRADQGVGVVDAVTAMVHAARQVLEVDLVDDAEARRHDAESVEGLHAPFHELVALLVALELQLHVQVQRFLRAVVVDHDGVVHDQVHRHQRLDGFGLLAQARGHAAHRRQVGQQRHAGEVLQHHARHDERDFLGARALRLPLGELAHMLGRDLLAVAMAQHGFEHDAQRLRQPLHAGILLGQRRQRIKTASLA
ncbi:hypothetical protein D3C78_1257130 [compost metagenome]